MLSVYQQKHVSAKVSKQKFNVTAQLLKLKHVSNMRNIAIKSFGISSSDTDVMNLANTKETCSILAIIVAIFQNWKM